LVGWIDCLFFIGLENKIQSMEIRDEVYAKAMR
jgi:hypothetical protein